MKKNLIYIIATALCLSPLIALSQFTQYRTIASGNWNQPSCWEASSNGVSWVPAPTAPDATDANISTITIRAGHTITVNTTVVADELTVESTATLRTTTGNLTVANGTDPFDLICNGTFEIVGGNVAGPGTVQINNLMNWSGGILAAPSIIETGANLLITATVTLQNLITINGTGTHTGGNFAMQNGTILVNNIWNENPGSNVQFVNSSGTNMLAVSATGTINKLGLATTTNNAPMNIAGSLNVQSGLFKANSATTSTGNLNIEDPGVVEVTLTYFMEPSSSVSGKGDLNVTTGTLALNTSISLTDVNLNFSGGLISGLGIGKQLNLAPGENEDDMVWNGGTLLNCKLVVEAGANLKITGPVSLQDDIIIDAGGTVEHNSSNVSFNNGKVIDNGTWISNLASNATFVNAGGTNEFIINETFRKAGTAILTNNISTTSTGLFIFEANGGTYINGASSEFSGDLESPVACTFENKSVLTLKPGFSMNDMFGTFVQSAGSTIAQTPVFVYGSLVMSSGSIEGDGPINIMAFANCSGGAMRAPFDIAVIAGCYFSGGFSFEDEVVNNGNVHQTGNVSCNNAQITNNGNWMFDLLLASSILNAAGTNHFQNNGTVRKKGTATATNNVSTTSVGSFLFDDNSGTYINNNNSEWSGNIDIAEGCTFENKSTMELKPGSSITGTGKLRQTLGTLTLTTALSLGFGFTFEMSGGTTAGTESLTLNGTMNWLGGIVDNLCTIGTTGIMNILNSVTLKKNLSNSGTIKHFAGNVSLMNVILTIDSIWNSTIAAAASILNTSGTNRIIINGKLEKDGTGTLTDGVHTINNGKLEVKLKSFVVPHILEVSGNIHLGFDCTLEQRGTTTFFPGSSLTGAGAFLQSLGITIFNADISTPVPFKISGGSTDGTGLLIFEFSGEASGGTIGNPVTVANGATFTFTAGSTTTLSDAFVNNSIVDFYAQAVNFANATFTNNDVLNLNSTAATSSFGNASGTNLLINSGTGVINKNNTNTHNNFIPLNHQGLINIIAGTFGQKNDMTHNGDLNIAHAQGRFLCENIFTFGAAAITRGNGFLTQSNGTMIVDVPTAITDNVTLELNGPAQTSGNALLTIYTEMIAAAEAGVNSPIDIATGALLGWSVGSTATVRSNINNNGTTNFFGQSLNFENGSFTNYGTLNLNSTGVSSFGNILGTNLLTNAATGIINKNNATAFASHIPMNNMGSILVNLGTFSQQNNINHSGNLQMGSVLSRFLCDGTFTCSLGNIIGGSGTFTMNSGTMAVDAPTTIPPNVIFELNGFASTIGTSLLTIGQRMFWAGEIGSPVKIGAQAVLDMVGAPTLKSHLTLEGIGNLPNVAVNFVNGIFEILSNGSLNVISTGGNSTFGSVSGTNQFYIRAGAFLRKSGSQFFANFIPTDVEGEWETLDGTSLQHTIMNITGKLKVAANKLFRFSDPSTANFNAGAQVEGAGTYEFNGTNNYNSDFEFPAGTNVTFNKGNWQGTATVKLGGMVTWNAGNFNVTSKIPPLGTMNIGTVDLPRFTEKKMTVEYGGTYKIQSGGSVTFSNILEVDGDIEYAPSPPSSTFNFTNGTLPGMVKFLPRGSVRSTSPTGVLNFGVIIDEAIQTSGLGTINFNAASPTKAKHLPGMSPGILTINSVSPLLGDSSLVEIEILDGSGAGTGHDQLRRNGNLVLDGTLNVLQTGTVPLGTYTIISLTSGTISGSFDVLNLPPGYSHGQTTNTVYVSKDTNALWQFRSKQNGDWHTSSTWEVSLNGNIWSNAPQAPTLANAELITIRSSHVVTLNSNTTVKKVILETGANLDVSAGTLLITN